VRWHDICRAGQGRDRVPGRSGELGDRGVQHRGARMTAIAIPASPSGPCDYRKQYEVLVNTTTAGYRSRRTAASTVAFRYGATHQAL
jgi:hypothetical protein